MIRTGRLHGTTALGLCALTTIASLALATRASAIDVLDEIGQPGTGPGGLAGVQGISVDGNGTLSAAQTPLNRVSRFDRNGSFVDAFGFDVIPGGGTAFEVCTAATTCQAGSGGGSPGELATPWATASSPDGVSLYVSEANNNRASQFSSAPAFTRAWGYGVIPGGGSGFQICTAGTGCQGGLGSASAGALATPLGVALGPDGRVHLTENSSRLHTYAADGRFVADTGPVIPGSGPGMLASPYDLAVDASGLIAVADTGNNRIDIYGPDGGFDRAFGFDVIPGGGMGFEVCTVETDCKAGTTGGVAGQLSNPAGVDFAPDGSLYVAEAAGARVSQFTAEGDFIRAFGFGVAPGGGAGFEECTPATTCQLGTPGNGAGQFGQPFGIAVDCRGSVYVSDPGIPRIQKFGDDPRLAPCPSNDIEIRKPKLNKKKGTARLPVRIPGPGELTLGGAGIKPVVQNPTVGGEAILPVKPTGRAKKKLRKKGKARVTALVGFTPVNGDQNLEESAFKLKRKSKRGKKG